MLTLTWAGSVGTFPARGGLFGLLAASAAGYWQLAPRSAGALKAGSWPAPVGAGSVGEAESLGGVVAAVAVLFESSLVKRKTATPTTAATIATAEAM